MKKKLKKLWSTITIPFYRIRFWIRERCWEVRYGFERMRKGYDSVDVFDLFPQFTKRYYKILVEFKKIHDSHPMNMTEEEWNDIINEMIYHLYFMDEYNIHKEFETGMFRDKLQDYKTMDEIMNKHKDKFFELFSKYFYDLWN